MSSSRRIRVLSILIGILVLGIAGPVHAATAFEMLRVDPTPRGSALAGNSLALMAGGLDAGSAHPGGLAWIETQQVSASYANHPLDIAGGRFAYGFPFEFGYGALSLSYLNYGSFDRRTSLETDPTGTFTPSDLLVSAGMGREVIKDVGVGVSLKYLRSEIDTYTSTAFAADLSVHWDTGWRMVDLAGGISNIGTQLETYGDTREHLPTEAHVGVAKQLEHLPLILTVTGHYDIDGNLWGALAGEFTVSELLKLRGGYTSYGPDYHVGGSQDTAAGISAGLGLNYFDITLDYAFYSQGALGQVHRLGVNYSF